MGRSPCCDKVGLKKGPWTPEEDQKLLAYIEENGHGSWRALPAKAGLQRCGKSCRLSWTNYLRPDIKRGKFSLQEEQTIIQLHALLGNRWSAIATHLPKRTDNEIKNYWNTHLKKRLAKMGIDPVTHKPKNDALLTNDGQSKSAANLSHMAQWETARLEAESRLARQSKKSMAPTTTTAAGPSRWNGADHDSPTSTLTCAEHVAAQVSTTNGIIGKPLGLHDLAADIAAWTTEDTVKAANTVEEHIPTGNFVETFTDLLLSTASADRSGPTDSINGGSSYYEENKNYWSSILNLVNSSPSDSQLF